MAVTDKPAKKKVPKSNSPSVTFKNFSQLLVDRINMKAAARGTGQAEYLIELFEKETQDLVEYQKKARRERELERKNFGAIEED